MNNEIKEILDRIETASEIFDCLLKPEECTDLLDYITNLQQENERLKAIWKDTNVIIKDNKSLVMNTNAYDTLNDYKSRCEKAIEYINHAQNYGTMAQVMPHLKPYVNGDDLLNILQNGSDDNV